MYIDNLIVAFLSALIGLCVFNDFIRSLVFSGLIIPFLAYAGIQIRFWRSPSRRLSALKNQIVSPADGNVIYINYLDAGEGLVSVKNGSFSKIDELTGSDLVHRPCIQIGINMTPFDVHKNCAPCGGKIVLSKHLVGKFHSLKEFISMTENERHTYVIQNNEYEIAVVQIASKRVRRIDSYVTQGQQINQGDWLGMIRFGSQVDVFLPIEAKIKVKPKQQIYAISTIIAELPE